nr:MAG TPA: hypothetical protein [Caudoviricetes sp.]
MEVGDNMELIFADATKIQIQSAQETGGKLEIKVIQVAPAQLRELFTDPVKTKIMRITEREQNIAEYEGYTEFYRTEEYTGGIYGVAMEKAGKTTAERLAEVETENAALKEALVNANTQITDLQGAICELYEMGVQA